MDRTQFDIISEDIRRIKEENLGLITLRLFFSSFSFISKIMDNAFYPYVMPTTMLIGCMWFWLNYLEAKAAGNVNVNLLGKIVSNAGLAILGLAGCILFFGFGIGSLFLISAAFSAIYAIKTIIKLSLSLSYLIRFFASEPGSKRKADCKERASRHAKSAFSAFMTMLVSVAITTLHLVAGPWVWVILGAAFFIKTSNNTDAIISKLEKAKSSVRKQKKIIEQVNDLPLKKLMTKKLLQKQIKILEAEEKYLALLKDRTKSPSDYTFCLLGNAPINTELDYDKIYFEFKNNKLFYQTTRLGKNKKEMTAEYFKNTETYEQVCKTIKEQEDNNKNWLDILIDHKQSILNITSQKAYAHTRSEPFSIRLISASKLWYYSFFSLTQKEEIVFLNTLQSKMGEEKPIFTPPLKNLNKKSDTYLVSELARSTFSIEENNVESIRFTDCIIETINMIEEKECREKFLLMLIDKKIKELNNSRLKMYSEEKIKFLSTIKEIIQKPPLTNHHTTIIPALIPTKISEQADKTTELNNTQMVAELLQLVPPKPDNAGKKDLKKIFFSMKNQQSETALLYLAALSHAYYDNNVELHEPGHRKGKFYYKDISSDIRKIKIPLEKKAYIIVLLEKKIHSFGNNPKGKEKNKKDALIWCLDWLKGDRAPHSFTIGKHSYTFNNIEEWISTIHKEEPRFYRNVITSKWENLGETYGLIREVSEFNKNHPKALVLDKTKPNTPVTTIDDDFSEQSELCEIEIETLSPSVRAY